MREKPAHDSLQNLQIAHVSHYLPFLLWMPSDLGVFATSVIVSWHFYILRLIIFSSTLLVISSPVKETKLNKRERNSERRFPLWDALMQWMCMVVSGSNISTCFLNLRDFSRCARIIREFIWICVVLKKERSTIC